jgi:hypothetical protein
MSPESSDRQLLAAVTQLADLDLPDVTSMAHDQGRAHERLFDRRDTRPRARRSIIFVLVGVFAAGAMTATATGVLRFAPASEEVQSLAEDNDVPRNAAREQLLREHGLSQLDATLRSKLPTDFAGLWVDKGQITVGVVETASPGAFAVVRDAAKRASIDPGAVAIVDRRSSLRDIARLFDSVRRRANRANAAAPEPIDVESDVKRGVVIVRAPSGNATTAQRRFLDAVRGYGASVEVGRSAGRLHDTMAGRAADR